MQSSILHCYVFGVSCFLHHLAPLIILVNTSYNLSFQYPHLYDLRPRNEYARYYLITYWIDYYQ